MMAILSDIRNWRRIRDAWERYCELGPSESEFDWDYDSRDLMTELTGKSVTYWYGSSSR